MGDVTSGVPMHAHALGASEGLYYVYTGTFLWASTGQPSLFDSVNSHKTELK